MTTNRLFEACPICVRWWCANCGAPKSSTVDLRNLSSDETRTCRRCSSTVGSFEPVRHYRRDVQDAHVRKFEMEHSVLPVPQERVNDVAALVEMIDPMIADYRELARRSLRTVKGSHESTLTINTGNETLLKIDDTIRSWLADHPDESYD
jgi:hypothetical protein